MAQVPGTAVDELLAHFNELEDPRSTINLQHPFGSVVMIVLMGILAGAGGPTAIAKWAKTKHEWLVKVLPLPAGVPGKDVFRRILMMMRPEVFQACFLNWLEALRAKAAEESGIDQPVFAVDGKTARRSHDKKKDRGALHSVSVWASEFGLSLGQVACAEKSNEITAIPELLQLVNIKGAIITIDAMGTQKAIAETIIDREADYLLALKGNQEKLHDAVIDYIDKQSQNDFADVEARRLVTKEKGHGREEIRSYIQMPVPADLADLELWKGLKTIGMAVSTCVRNGKETTEIRYYISSLELGVKRFAHAIRSHWGIENSCHWSLDFTFREDESRIREKNVRENFAWLNRFLLSLLKQHPSKDSVVMRRRACGWDENFMLQVLTGTTV
ncbi:MAG: ISAs1 family transposase [Planctomycetes bacterium]|nr:ISAs1 family transposase [Planctomycetota bacterium]